MLAGGKKERPRRRKRGSVDAGVLNRRAQGRTPSMKLGKKINAAVNGGFGLAVIRVISLYAEACLCATGEALNFDTDQISRAHY